jgi:hypothetical protein
MADERYIVELILKARDDTRGAFEKAIGNNQQLSRVLQQAESDYDDLTQATRRLREEEERATKASIDANKQKEKEIKLTKDVASAQLTLKRAAENYARVATKSNDNDAEKLLALEALEEATLNLAEAQEKQKDVTADQSLATAEAFKEEQRSLALRRELSRATLDEAASRAQVLELIEEEGRARKRLSSIEDEAYRDSVKRVNELIENNKNLEISQDDANEAVRRGQKIRKDDVDAFEKDTKRLIDLKNDVQQIDKKLTSPETRQDPVITARLQVDRESAIAEIESLQEDLVGQVNIRRELEFDIDEGSVARLKATEELLEKGLGIKVPVEFDIDNTSLIRTAGIMALLNGAFDAFSDGADKASKRIAAFDNIVRGLLVLAIAVFLQQLALSAAIAAGALAGLVSSAIAAGGAIGGALTAGVAQALPALGIIATFLNRFQAINQAVKQQNLQQQQASYSGGQAARSQANGLDQVVAATERVKEAQDKVTESRKKAREALEDLILSERKQTLGLQKSREDLNEALTSGAGSFAVSQAEIAAEEAANQLGRTRDNLRTRTRGGIEGSPEVTQAKKQLEEARRALDQARQAGDAAGQSVSAAAGKLNFLVGNLSRAEKRLFDALVVLQERWRKFAQQITGPLTNAFTFAVKRITNILGSKELIEVGKSTSKTLGDSFRSIFEAVLSPETISRILNLSKQFTTNLRPITQIAITLSRVFLDIAEAGAPAFRTILEYVNDLVQKLGEFTSSVEGKNALADFFDLGAQSLIKFVDLFLSIGNVILALIDPKGAGGITAGNTILDQLTEGFNNLAEAIRTPGTRANEFFKRFFDFGTKTLPLFKPLLVAIADLIDNLFSPKGLESVRNFVTFLTRVVVPAFGFFLKTVTSLTDAIVKLIDAFEPFEALVKFVVGVALVGSVFGRLLGALSPITSTVGFLIRAATKTTVFGKILSELTQLFPQLKKFESIRERIAKTEQAIATAQAAQDTGVPGTTAGRRAAGEAADGGGPTVVPVDAPGRGRLGRVRETVSRGVGRLRQTRAVRGVASVGARIAGTRGGAAALAGLQGLRSGPVVAAIVAITAAITALLAVAGRLDDVWRAFTSSISGVFSAIKDEVNLVIRDVKEIFDSGNAGGEDFVEKLKAIGNVLADVLIPAIKILVALFGGVLLTGFKVVGAVIRSLARLIVGIVDTIVGLYNIIVGLFTGDNKQLAKGFNQLAEGILRIFQGIGGLILDILAAPFSALGSVVEKLFISATDKVKGVFDNVLKFVFDGIDFLIDKFNDLAPSFLEVGKINYQTAAEKEASQKREAAAARREAERDDISSGERAAGGGSRRVDSRGRRVTRGRAKSNNKPSEATNADAENFLTSFNPETVKLSDEITRKLANYWRTLRRQAKDSANYVTEKLGEIRKNGGRSIDRFVNGAQQDIARMRRSFRTNFLGIAAIVRNQMLNVSNIVVNQMENAAMAIYKGAKYIKTTLNDALKSVGADGVDLTIEVPKIRKEEKAEGGFVGRAGGGWIGNRGERGRDMVPTMLGRGEAVLNWGQQKIVEPALRQTYGFGLDDMFDRTSGYHAGGPRNSPGLARGGRGRDGVYTASVYNDAQGYKSDALSRQPYNWAELGINGGIGNALGGLPYKTMIKVSYKGKSVNLKKLDIGSGGPGLGGKIRAVDIWQTAANKLRLPGLANVYVSFSGRAGSAGAAAEEIAMPKIRGGSKAMRDMVSKGLDKFRKAANEKIEKETPVDVTGGGDLSVGKGVAGSLRQAIALARSLGLTISSTNEGYPGDGVHTPSSWHYKGRALDAYGSPAQMAAFFRAALKRYGRNILELFYDPLGAIKNGQSVAAVGDHTDHVHLALARGGKASERKRLELARKERAAQRKYDKMKVGNSLKKYAAGGAIDGPEGQAVPIMAHAGEWVLNRRQQNMVAGIAGTTADRLKGMLGFTGGPTSFKGGGVPQIPRSFRSNPFEVIAGTLPTLTSGFEEFNTLIEKVFDKINTQTRRLLTPERITKKIKEVEKAIKELEEGKEDDKQKKEIEKLKKALDNLKNRKDIQTLLASVSVLTGTDGTGGVLGDFYNAIKNSFDATTRTFRLAAEGLKNVGGKLVSGTPTADEVDPEKLALLEANAQKTLRDNLIGLRNQYQDTYASLEASLQKFKSPAELKTSIDKDTKTIAEIDKKLERLNKDDEDEGQKKKIKQLEKEKKRIEDRLKKTKKDALERGKLQSELENVLKQIGEKDDEILEAERNRIENEKTAFEEATNRAVRANERISAFESLKRSLADLGYSIESLGGALLNIGNPVAAIRGSLETAAATARSNYATLTSRLEEAKRLAAADPRFQSLVDDLETRVAEAALAAAQAQAEVVTGTISAIESQLSKGDSARAILDRGAALAERTLGVLNSNYENNVIGVRRANLQTRGADLQNAFNELNAVDRTNLNDEQRRQLEEKLDDLRKSIEENTQDVQALTIQYRKAQLEAIQSRTQATTGRLGTLGGILSNVNKIAGTPDTAGQIAVAQATGNALVTEGQDLVSTILAALNDPEGTFAKSIEEGGFGQQGIDLINQIIAAFQGGDPAAFANLLITLGPQIDALTATLGTDAAPAFNEFIDSLVNNTSAVVENTANLAELNGLANQPQAFSTTAWTRFRAAIFNGLGDVLPQFDGIPQMATGGYVTRGGMFELHAGEFVVNPSGSNIDQGDINITVNEANRPLDVTALASRIAFEKRTRK